MSKKLAAVVIVGIAFATIFIHPIIGIAVGIFGAMAYGIGRLVRKRREAKATVT